MPQDRVVIHASVMKSIGVGGAMLAVALIVLAYISDTEARAWIIGIGLAAIGGGVLAARKFDRPRVTITRDGFEVHTLLESGRFRWSDVEGPFRTIYQHKEGDAVAFNLSASGKQRIPSMVLRGGGPELVIPNRLDIEPDALVRVLNNARAKAEGRAINDEPLLTL